MKKVLVSGYIGFNNFGDEAIFLALTNRLKYNNCTVSALSSNIKETQKKYDVKAFYYKNIFSIFAAILNCDILISGGGSLLQNKTSSFSLYYYLFIIFLAKLLNKKVVIFSQGFEPIKGKMNEFLMKIILKNLKYISTRDKKSHDYLKSLNIDSIITSDPAYSLVQDLKIEENKKGLIIQLREFKGIDEKLIYILALIVSKYYKDNIDVLALQDTDEKICSKFIDELKKRNINANLIVNKDVNETIDIINKAKFIISTRLHGLIAASALKTNSFALIYDEKVKTLCDELNIQNINTLDYTKDELDNKLNEFLNHCLNEVHPYRRFDWVFIDSVIKI